MLDRILGRSNKMTIRRDRARSDRRRDRQPNLESLEQRLVLSTITWIGPSGGDYDVPANWSPKQVPTAADDAVITLPSGSTVVHLQGNGDSVKTLTLSAGTTLGLSAGSLSVVNASTLDGGVAVTGGNLYGDVNLTLKGASSWTAGSLNGTITNAGTLAINGGGTVYLQGALDNTGTITLSGSTTVQANSGSASIDNQSGATFDSQGNDYLYSYYTGTFSNEGLFKKSAGVGTTTIGYTFNNTGSVEVDSGTLAPTDGGTTTGGTFLVKPSATYNLTGGNTYTYAGTETGSGGGTVLLNSGTLTTTGTATFNFPTPMLVWDGGSLGGTVVNAGTLAINGGGTIYLQGTLDNTGTVTLSGNTTVQANAGGATIDNAAGATFDSQGNDDLYSYYTGTFSNEGLFKKSGATGTTTTIGYTFNNTGNVEVDSGTLEPTNGGTTTGGTFNVAASAVYDVAGNATYSFAGIETGSGKGAVRLDNGLLTTPAAGATLNFPSGLFQWTGGSLGGMITNTGFMAINGGGTVYLQGVLDNQGTVTLSGNTTVQANASGATIDNAAGATFDSQGNDDLYSYYTGTFSNEGLFKKSAGVGTTTIGYTFNNTGSVEVDSGTLAPTDGGTTTGGTFLVKPSATYNLTGGNTYTYAGTETGSGGGTVLLNSGTLATTGTATFNFPTPMLVWDGGTLNGTLLNAGVLAINGGGTVYLQGVLDNQGTVTLSGNTTVQANASGATIDNAAGATFDSQGNDYLYSYYTGTFSNEGLFKKSGGTSAPPPSATPSTIRATVEVDSGTLAPTDGGTTTGGTFLVKPSATYNLTGGNTYTYAGTETGSGGGTVLLNSGTLATTGTATFNFPTPMLVWDGGTLNGTLLNAGVLAINGGGTLYLDGTLANKGTTTLSGSTTIQANASGATIDNQAGGTFKNQGSNSLYSYYTGTFTNEGYVQSSGYLTDSFVTTNSGTLVVLAGTVDVGNLTNFAGSTLTGGTYELYGALRFPGANVATNAATINLHPGGQILDSNNNNNALANFATNAAAGKFILQAGVNFATQDAFTNAGSVIIGGPTGVHSAASFTSTGTYAQTGGNTDLFYGGHLDRQ